MNRYEVLTFIGMIVLLSLTIFFVHNKQSEQPDDPPASNNHEHQDQDIYWGVDSASYTDENIFQCVVDNFGKPSVWGRYLGDIEGVSAGLDTEEVNFLHENDVHILIIYNHFSDATGYDHGVEEAKQAISFAEELDIPEGVAIFGDIEPKYPVDENFMNGWYDTLANSPYEPGIYGVFNEDSELFTSFTKTKEEAKENIVLWTAYPQKEVTDKNSAPKYNPQGPDESNLYGWQYAIDAETCNIDTNLFTDQMINILWKYE